MLSFKVVLALCFSHIIFLLVDSIDVKHRPGIRTLLTPKGLNYVRKIAIPIIVEELNHVEIPAVTGNVDLYIAKLKYNFTKITLSKVKIPDSHISVVNNSGILVKGDHLTFSVNELWTYAFDSWLSDSGSCVVSGKKVSLEVFVGFGKGSQEELHVIASRCNLHIGDFDIEFHGEASWLYNTLASTLKDILRNDIQELICKTATKVINKKLNDALKTIPDEERYLNNTIKDKIELVNPPLFNSDYGMELDFKGEYQNIEHAVKAPYIPGLLPPFTGQLPCMVYLWATSYTCNTILFSLYQTKMLHTTILKEDLPSDVPVTLETNSFIFVVPPLYDKYPDKDMAVGLNTTSPPTVELRENEGTLVEKGIITVFVVDDNRFINCFTLNVKAKLTIDKFFLEQRGNHSYLAFTLSNVQTDVSLLESRIGEFDVELLQFTIDVLSQFIVTRYVTAWGRKGAVLPLVEGVKLYNTKSVMKKDYILLSGDFIYEDPR